MWMDSVLTVSRSRWTIVVGHHPIYSATPKGGNTQELIDEVLPILKKHHVPLYVAGHQHFMQHLKRETMDFVVSGGGSDHGTVTRERDDVVFGLSALGFVSVTVTPKLIQLKIADATNAVLHEVRIAAPAAVE